MNMTVRNYFTNKFSWSKGAKSIPSAKFKYPEDFLAKPEQHPFFEQFKRLIYALSITGRFPFVRDANGYAKYSMYSFAGLYWIVLFSLELIAASDILKESFFNMFNDNVFNVVLWHARNSLIMFTLLLLPLNHLKEWKRLAVYINNWDKFLISFKRQTGRELTIEFKRYISICLVLIPMAFTAGTYIENESMGIVKPYHQVLYVLVFSGASYCCFMWAFCHVLVHQLADYLLEELVKLGDKSRRHLRVTSSEIQKLRYLWVNGASLLMNTGECMGVSMLVICLSNSACFVVAAYGFMSAIIGRDDISIFHHFINLLAGLAFLFVGCESGYWSTKKMGDNIAAALSAVEVSNLSEPAARELNMFLQTHSLNPPIVKCAGIITVGRSYLTTMFSSTITYLIVLVQFKISDMELAQNNKTIVSTYIENNL